MSLDAALETPTYNRRMWVTYGVSVLVAGIVGAVLALVIDSGTPRSGVSTTTAPIAVSYAAVDDRLVPSIMSLTPAGLAAGVLGTGYALPTPQRGPTLASVLASMSPETRRYTEKVTSLTFAQLALGAAGSP